MKGEGGVGGRERPDKIDSNEAIQQYDQNVLKKRDDINRDYKIIPRVDFSRGSTFLHGYRFAGCAHFVFWSNVSLNYTDLIAQRDRLQSIAYFKLKRLNIRRHYLNNYGI